MYQISQKLWPPRRFRLEIWEGERWQWPVGRKSSAGKSPQAGDIVVFFYPPTGGGDPGFYGWAVVQEWNVESSAPLYFRPVSPSDHLKMHPWWDQSARKLAERIRGKFKQGTLWLVPEELVPELRRGITAWVGNKGEMLQSESTSSKC
jgi:hypothetical protein